MKVLVTGGCGYIGSVLVPKLLAAGHLVRVVDTQWFGVNLAPDSRLHVIQGDIRDKVPCEGIEAVIHLAAIANDPCGELDARLTWDVNVIATLKLAEECARQGVKRFIYASSASVYGIQDNVAVTEDSLLEPVSDYNRTKMVAERVLRSFDRHFSLCIVRPATVCGVSPRMRLDTLVNMLTAQALETRKITAHCGAHGEALMRPHTHIEDMTDLYVLLLKRQWCGTYNAGFENQRIADTAHAIKSVIACEVEISETSDKRSYAVDSARVRGRGFLPQHTVAEAILDIAVAWRSGALKREERCVNLTWMQKNGYCSSTR